LPCGLARRDKHFQDDIYVIYAWPLAQAVVVARKPFYSAIPKNREQARNIPANCKTFSGTLNRVRSAVNRHHKAAN
jgi:hypothetical protein